MLNFLLGDIVLSFLCCCLYSIMCQNGLELMNPKKKYTFYNKYFIQSKYFLIVLFIHHFHFMTLNAFFVNLLNHFGWALVNHLLAVFIFTTRLIRGNSLQQMGRRDKQRHRSMENSTQSPLKMKIIIIQLKNTLVSVFFLYLVFTQRSGSLFQSY